VGDELVAQAVRFVAFVAAAAYMNVSGLSDVGMAGAALRGDVGLPAAYGWAISACLPASTLRRNANGSRQGNSVENGGINGTWRRSDG